MSISKNPFATFVDPTAIFVACAESGVLGSLPVSARHRADRRPLKDTSLERHDAEIDCIWEALIAKAWRSSSPVKLQA